MIQHNANMTGKILTYDDWWTCPHAPFLHSCEHFHPCDLLLLFPLLYFLPVRSTAFFTPAFLPFNSIRIAFFTPAFSVAPQYSYKWNLHRVSCSQKSCTEYWQVHHKCYSQVWRHCLLRLRRTERRSQALNCQSNSHSDEPTTVTPPATMLNMTFVFYCLYSVYVHTLLYKYAAYE